MVLDSDQPRCPAAPPRCLRTSTAAGRRYAAPPQLSPGRRRWPPSSAASACSSGPSRLGGTQPAPERPETVSPAQSRAGRRAGGCAPPPDSPGSAGAGRAGWRSTAGQQSPRHSSTSRSSPRMRPAMGGTSPVLVLEPGQGLLNAAARTALPIPDPSLASPLFICLFTYRACPAPAGRAAREKFSA